MCSEDALFMKKLIRFIKDNPLVKGKIYFYIFKFFFHHESWHRTLLPKYVSITIQLHMRSFCEKKISNLSFQYLIIFLF